MKATRKKTQSINLRNNKPAEDAHGTASDNTGQKIHNVITQDTILCDKCIN